MAISGVGLKFYQNNVGTVKSIKNVNSTEKFALEKTNDTQELSEAEEMELFKKEFYDDLSKVTNHRTVSNAAVNISEAAFKAMKDDPQYREKVLSLIQRDWGDSYASRNCSVLITVGATLNEYRADSWPVGYDSEFDVRSQNSFYKRTSEKKDRQKELLEEYLEKRAQMKKQQQEMLNEKIAKQERSRLAKARSSERQMAERPANLSIFEEGRNMLREMAGRFEPASDYINARELTIQNTNEVAWEHYAAMQGVSSQTLKDGNYNVEDVMKSIMDTYETRYNEIVKAHENGDREVSYELTGKRSLTLDEDLAGLYEAYKMRLANLAGYITCQQTNNAFENPNSSWYFHRNATQNEGKTQDKPKLFSKN